MRRVSRFQVAAGVTALFVGGTIAAGIALRPETSMDAGATQTAATPVSVTSRTSLSSRTSPGGGGSAGGYESEDAGEIEHGESD